jgi:hypothetical protein
MMDAQTLLALAVVAIVAIVLVRWKIRTIRQELSSPCTGGCTCSAVRMPERKQGPA